MSKSFKDLNLIVYPNVQTLEICFEKLSLLSKLTPSKYGGP